MVVCMVVEFLIIPPLEEEHSIVIAYLSACSVLVWQCCNVLCTSTIVDDVKFVYSQAGKGDATGVSAKTDSPARGGGGVTNLTIGTVVYTHTDSPGDSARLGAELMSAIALFLSIVIFILQDVDSVTCTTENASCLWLKFSSAIFSSPGREYV